METKILNVMAVLFSWFLGKQVDCGPMDNSVPQCCWPGPGIPPKCGLLPPDCGCVSLASLLTLKTSLEARCCPPSADAASL